MWNERTKLAAAAAAAAAGLFVAILSLIRPTGFFGTSSPRQSVPLPESYSSYRIFDEGLIDTEPTEAQLGTTIAAFSDHIQDQSRKLGFTRAQCADLAAVASERLQGMIDPDIERDCAQAAKRGLRTPSRELITQATKFYDQVGRLALASFGLRSTIVIPQNYAGAEKYYSQLSSVDYISQVSTWLPSKPEYDQTGISASSPRVEVLFPLRVPVMDMKKGKFTSQRKAVVVFGFVFAWAESGSRQQWVPEKYFQYKYENSFPRPEDWDAFMTVGYPMAF
jgi:hypothetical protein